MTNEDREQCEQQLRAGLQAKTGELTDLFRAASDEWGYEDQTR
jgi:hypothetical protein